MYVYVLLWTIFLLAACTTAPSASDTSPTPDLEATVAAGIQATNTASAPAATSAPTDGPQIPTAKPTITLTRPTTAPTDEPTATSAPTDEPASTSTPIGPAPTADEPDTATTQPEEVSTTFRPGDASAANKQVNVQLVFDASGSMAEDIGGETKIEAARRAMEQVINGLDASKPNLNVGFRVFGHEGDNTEAGRAQSCQSTEQLVPLAGVDTALLRQQSNTWEPTGWTPISLALQEAGAALPASGQNVRNVIILVTDGEETCDGDPCAVAEALAASEAEVRIDVVGFGLTPAVADTLRCIHNNSDGTYVDAQDSATLAQGLEELIQGAIERSLLNIQILGADGNLTGDALVELYDEAGEIVSLLDEVEGSGQPGLRDGKERIELAPGTYTLNINGTSANQHIHNITEYTVEIVQGQETVAVVGFGGIVLTNPGGGLERNSRGDAFTEIEVQRNIGGAWEDTLYETYPPADEIIPLTPGEYRVVYTGSAAGELSVVADSITIEPGKRVTVEIDLGSGETSQPRPTADDANGEVVRGELGRTILSIEVIDANGERTGNVIIDLYDEAGEDVSLRDEVEGSGRPGLRDGYERVEVAPGSYVLEVDGTSANQHIHDTTEYPVEVAAGEETSIVVGFGGIVLTNPGGELNSRGGAFRDIEVQRNIDGTWEDTLFATYPPAEELISLAPGEYRVVYTGEGAAVPEILADNISIEPGTRIDIELARSGGE
jgi:hypothetical protein